MLDADGRPSYVSEMSKRPTRPEAVPARATDATPVSAVRPVDHPRIATPKIGVLLLNLGTPDGTDYRSMRRYLKQFLSDRRVIDVNRLLWWPLLNLVILTTRPGRKGRDYAKIWNRERDESPLKTVTRAQAEKLMPRLAGLGEEVVVDWAMRYGNPSTASRIRALVERGCTRILLLPLYPQYSAATTATACDEAFRALMRERWQPAVRTARPYFDRPEYVDAIVRSIVRHLDNLPWEPEVVLASFHGLPHRYLELGDPYYCHCMKTARLVREKLGWPEQRLRVAFQSRFGREEWLRPYTDETVIELAESGVRNIAVVAPGFSADCLETLEELDIGVREMFVEHGGERFTYIPCLNDDSDHISMLATLARDELQGWV